MNDLTLPFAGRCLAFYKKVSPTEETEKSLLSIGCETAYMLRSGAAHTARSILRTPQDLTYRRLSHVHVTPPIDGSVAGNLDVY